MGTMLLKKVPCLKNVCICIFNCLCLVNELKTDILEEQVLEERDPDLNEEDDIKMTDSRQEHWRYVAEDDEDMSVAHCTTCTTRELETIDKQFAIECLNTLRSELQKA